MVRTVSRSVERAFAIIALFKQQRTPMTASQVRQALNAPHTSTHSILREMTDLGYLSFDDARKTYFPAIELEFLCNWIQRAVAGSGELAHVTDLLCSQVNETVSISRQHYIFTTVVYVKRPEHPLAVHLPLGNLGAPMCQTVVGRVILSMMADAEIEKIIGYTNRWSRVTKAGFNFKTADVMDEVAKVRRDGYLFDLNTWTPGLGAVAAPILGKGDAGQNMALTVAGAVPRLQMAAKKIIPAVKAAARQLSATPAVRGKGP
jgi:DNA-binding IclR family transcriptional regulator